MPALTLPAYNHADRAPPPTTSIYILIAILHATHTIDTATALYCIFNFRNLVEPLIQHYFSAAVEAVHDDDDDGGEEDEKPDYLDLDTAHFGDFGLNVDEVLDNVDFSGAVPVKVGVAGEKAVLLVVEFVDPPEQDAMNDEPTESPTELEETPPTLPPSSPRPDNCLPPVDFSYPPGHPEPVNVAPEPAPRAKEFVLNIPPPSPSSTAAGPTFDPWLIPDVLPDAAGTSLYQIFRTPVPGLYITSIPGWWIVANGAGYHFFQWIPARQAWYCYTDGIGFTLDPETQSVNTLFGDISGPNINGPNLFPQERLDGPFWAEVMNHALADAMPELPPRPVQDPVNNVWEWDGLPFEDEVVEDDGYDSSSTLEYEEQDLDDLLGQDSTFQPPSSPPEMPRGNPFFFRPDTEGPQPDNPFASSTNAHGTGASSSNFFGQSTDEPRNPFSFSAQPAAGQEEDLASHGPSPGPRSTFSRPRTRKSMKKRHHGAAAPGPRPSFNAPTGEQNPFHSGPATPLPAPRPPPHDNMDIYEDPDDFEMGNTGPAMPPPPPGFASSSHARQQDVTMQSPDQDDRDQLLRFMDWEEENERRRNIQSELPEPEAGQATPTPPPPPPPPRFNPAPEQSRAFREDAPLFDFGNPLPPPGFGSTPMFKNAFGQDDQPMPSSRGRFTFDSEDEDAMPTVTPRRQQQPGVKAYGFGQEVNSSPPHVSSSSNHEFDDRSFNPATPHSSQGFRLAPYLRSQSDFGREQEHSWSSSPLQDTTEPSSSPPTFQNTHQQNEQQIPAPNAPSAFNFGFGSQDTERFFSPPVFDAKPHPERRNARGRAQGRDRKR